MYLTWRIWQLWRMGFVRHCITAEVSPNSSGTNPKSLAISDGRVDNPMSQRYATTIICVEWRKQKGWKKAEHEVVGCERLLFGVMVKKNQIKKTKHIYFTEI